MQTSYRQGLHDQLQQLVERGIGIRRRLDLISHGMRFAGDALDTERLRQRIHAELVYLDKEKSRLRHELGIREPIGAIKLSVPVRARKSTATRKTEVERTIAARGYLTRDLGW